MNNQPILSRLPAAPLLLVLSLGGLSSCLVEGDMPYVPPRDAGHHSWVRQVVPVLYGRKPRNVHEVDFLSDMAATVGRRPVLEAMMQSPEYVHQWTDVITEVLQLERWDNCRNTATLVGDHPEDDGELATFILTSPGTDTYHEDFNVASVIQSSLHLDNMAPVYLANLYVLQSAELGQCERSMRDMGESFAHRMLNRQRDCLGCHNSDYSTTGPNSGWNRHYTLPATSLDSAMWNKKSTDLNPALHYTVFREGQMKPAPEAGFARPWGRMLGVGAVQQVQPGMNLWPSTEDTFGSTNLDETSMMRLPAIGTVERKLRKGVSDLADGFDYQPNDDVVETCGRCEMCETLSPVPPEAPPFQPLMTWIENTNICTELASGTVDASDADLAAEVQTLFMGLPGTTDGACGTCHQPQGVAFTFADNQDFWMALRTAGVLDGVPTELQAILESGSMPANGTPLTANEMATVQTWLNSIEPANQCDTVDCNNIPETQVSDDEAFAYQVATNFVDQVWMRTMGHSLTTVHSFPRNAGQRDILQHLTDDAFLANDWSLQEVLVEILASDYFARVPPADAPAGVLAYEVPPIYDPWWVYDPRIPGMDPTPSTPLTDADELAILQTNSDRVNNAMTEGLARHRPGTLVRSASAALGRPDHQRVTYEGLDQWYYPSLAFYEAIGQPINDRKPGFNEFDLAGMLRWEGTMLAPELDPNPSIPIHNWIDDLVDTATVTPGVTNRDLVVALRDRLLSDGTIHTDEPTAFEAEPGIQSEEEALEAVFGAPLDDAMGSPTTAKLRLEDIAGVLLTTPDFMIAGWASDEPGPIPFADVCLPGEACNLFEICLQYKPYFFETIGPFDIGCTEDGPEFAAVGADGEMVALQGPYDGGANALCPSGQCGFISIPIRETMCEEEPERCFDLEPPTCDPRCSSDADCCGASPPAFPHPGLHVLWADGSRIDDAMGVLRYLPRSSSWEAVRKGDVLSYGTLLEVPADGQLTISAPADDRDGEPFIYEAPPYDMTEVAPRHLMISGPPVLERLQALEHRMEAVVEHQAANAAAHEARAKASTSLQWGILDGPPKVDFENLRPEGYPPKLRFEREDTPVRK